MVACKIAYLIFRLLYTLMARRASNYCYILSTNALVTVIKSLTMSAKERFKNNEGIIGKLSVQLP